MVSTSREGVGRRDEKFTPFRTLADNSLVLIGRRTTRAGVYAERRYQRGLESWRLETMPEGECKTEKALRPLEQAGWSVVHDLRRRYGNYDHIAVGPAGVYLFETKNLQGILDIRCGAPHLRRRHDPDASVVFRRYRPRALGAAASLEEQIQEHSGYSTWVQAVVVFWAEFPEGLVEDGRCVYIHGARLREWLGERPQRLDEEQLAHIARVVNCPEEHE